MLSIQQIKFCGFLVARQAGSAAEVARVCTALEWAHSSMPRLTIDSIKYLASLVNDDVRGFRSIELQHNSPVDEIQGHMLQLIDAWEIGKTDPRHLFWEFCAIHPFGVNVNQSVAVIIYNWANHTAGHPVFPPAYGLNGEGGV